MVWMGNIFHFAVLSENLIFRYWWVRCHYSKNIISYYLSADLNELKYIWLLRRNIHNVNSDKSYQVLLPRRQILTEEAAHTDEYRKYQASILYIKTKWQYLNINRSRNIYKVNIRVLHRNYYSSWILYDLDRWDRVIWEENIELVTQEFFFKGPFIFNYCSRFSFIDIALFSFTVKSQTIAMVGHGSEECVGRHAGLNFKYLW